MATFAQLQAAFYARGYDYLNDGGVGQTAAKTFLNQAYLELCEEELWPFVRTTTTGASPVAIPNLRSIDSVVDSTSRQPLHWASSDDLIDKYVDLTTTGAPDYFYVDDTSGDQTISTWSFETGLEGWAQANFTTFAQQGSVHATSGTQVLRAGGTIVSASASAYSPTFAVTPLVPHTARGDIYVNTAANGTDIGLINFEWDDGNGTFVVGFTVGTQIAAGVGARVAVNNGAVAPAGASRARLRVTGSTSGSSAIDWELDNISVSQNADVPYVRTYPVGGTLSIRYYRVPLELVADNDVAIVPHRFCNLIVDGAVRSAGAEDAPAASAAAEASRQRGLDLMRRSLMFRDGMRHYQRVTGASGDW